MIILQTLGNIFCRLGNIFASTSQYHVDTEGCVQDTDLVTSPLIPDIVVEPEWLTSPYNMNDAAGGVYGAPLPFPATFTIPTISGPSQQAASLEWGLYNPTVINKITVTVKLSTHNGGINPDQLTLIPVDWDGNQLSVISNNISPTPAGGSGSPVGSGVLIDLTAADVGTSFTVTTTLASPIKAEGIWLHASLLSKPTGSVVDPVIEIENIVLNPERGFIDIPAEQITLFTGKDKPSVQKTIYTRPEMDLLNGTGDLTATQTFHADCGIVVNSLLGIPGQFLITNGSIFKFSDLGISSVASFSIVPQLPDSTLWEMSLDAGDTWSGLLSGVRNYGEGTEVPDRVQDLWIMREPAALTGEISISWEE